MAQGFPPRLDRTKEAEFLADSKHMTVVALAAKYQLQEKTAYNTKKRLLQKELAAKDGN